MNSPQKIKLHKQSQQLELQFADANYFFPAEFLRVHSPSAEVKGHGPSQEVLQFGKKDVQISQLEAAGNYGLKIHFSDGHNTGIFTWNYLQQLGTHQAQIWQDYLEKLHKAGKSRERDTQVVKFIGD
jgi:DUF971 family protein